MSDHNTGEMAWDDAAFVRRVEEACRRQHRSVRDVCGKAGLADDYLNKAASKKGRSIGAVLAIARELGAEPAELLGVVPAEERIDRDRLGRLALVANVAAHLYVSLDSRRTTPAVDDPSEIVSAIINLFERSSP